MEHVLEQAASEKQMADNPLGSDAIPDKCDVAAMEGWGRDSQNHIGEQIGCQDVGQ